MLGPGINQCHRGGAEVGATEAHSYGWTQNRALSRRVLLVRYRHGRGDAPGARSTQLPETHDLGLTGSGSAEHFDSANALPFDPFCEFVRG